VSCPAAFSGRNFGVVAAHPLTISQCNPPWRDEAALSPFLFSRLIIGLHGPAGFRRSWRVALRAAHSAPAGPPFAIPASINTFGLSFSLEIEIFHARIDLIARQSGEHCHP